MKKLALAALAILLYALHQDVWLWDRAHPLFLGFLPPGLTYHAAYCLASSLLMAALVRWAWPNHLAEEVRRAAGDRPPGERLP